MIFHKSGNVQDQESSEEEFLTRVESGDEREGPVVVQVIIPVISSSSRGPSRGCLTHTRCHTHARGRCCCSAEDQAWYRGCVAERQQLLHCMPLGKS